jgi:endonuclease YncB( thermonuclease family)
MVRASRHLLGCALLLAVLAGPARAADPVVVAGGDVACDPADADFNSGDGETTSIPGRCHQRYTADLIQSLTPTRLLALGDLQYEDGRLPKFMASYDLDTSWGRDALKPITFPVPGNHEYGASGSNFDATAAGYFTYFSDELAPFGADANDPHKGWYSFNLGSWHLVAINSECVAGLRVAVGWEGGCAVGSAQEQWLRRDLAADHHPCTLAYWHHPRFSSGTDDSTLTDNPGMAPIWQALQDHYADVVLSGHAHHYERYRLQDAAGNAAPGRGIRQWIVGTGGKEMTTLNPSPDPGTEIRSNTAFGVLALTLHGPSSAHPHGGYEWRFFNDGHSGSTFTDSGSADCVAPPAAPRQATAAPKPPVTPTAAAPAPKAQRIAARITRILDGRTLGARARGKRYTVRLLGIDSPRRKPAECGGRSAARKLGRLTFIRGRGRRVTLITDPTQPTRDRRRRLLAYVKRGRLNLGQSQLRAGWAKVRRTSPKFQLFDGFRSAQRKARRTKRGIWHGCGGRVHRRIRG